MFFNALLASLVAVLPDQVPTTQRGVVSGILAVCLPTASVAGTYLVQGALPFSLAPGIAPAILAVGAGSYGVLFTVAGACAISGAAAIMPIKGVR